MIRFCEYFLDNDSYDYARTNSLLTSVDLAIILLSYFELKTNDDYYESFLLIKGQF